MEVCRGIQIHPVNVLLAVVRRLPHDLEPEVQAGKAVLGWRGGHLNVQRGLLAERRREVVAGCGAGHELHLRHVQDGLEPPGDVAAAVVVRVDVRG